MAAARGVDGFKLIREIYFHNKLICKDNTVKIGMQEIHNQYKMSTAPYCIGKLALASR